MSEARINEVRTDADDLANRHTELKRRFRLLYNGYRALRYKLEDEWPPAAGAPPRVPHENVVISGTLEEIIRYESVHNTKYTGNNEQYDLHVMHHHLQWVYLTAS